MWRHRFYLLGVGLKGLDGFLETVGGALFLLVHQGILERWVSGATSAMLDGDTDDWIAHSVQTGFASMSHGARFFAACYLLGHGVLKIFIVGALFRRHAWAFVTAITILSLFVAIQIIRLFSSYSTGLLLLTLVDVVVAFLIWAEFSHRGGSPGKRPVN